MKIEAGKYYNTRDGRKVGPMRYDPGCSPSLCFDVDSAMGSYDDDIGGGLWNEEGLNERKDDRRLDLISEWQDESPSPIRTVTRREIVAGMYGRVVIGENGSILLPQRIYTAEELREAAHILNQIAEVLEENGNA